MLYQFAASLISPPFFAAHIAFVVLTGRVSSARRGAARAVRVQRGRGAVRGAETRRCPWCWNAALSVVLKQRQRLENKKKRRENVLSEMKYISRLV